MNVKQDGARQSKMQTKTLKLRGEFWSEVTEDDLWHRKRQTGWITIPRTMPIIVNIIDSLTKNASAGNTYFSLWCRSFDEQVIEIQNPSDLASESGFSGERAVYTWRQRMKSLKSLGFIDTHAGSHDYQFILLLNPHKVIKRMKGEIPQNLYNQLFSRALDIGARDMTEDEAEAAAETQAEPTLLL